MRRTTLLALSLLSFGALLPAACTQNFDIFGPSGGTGAGGGSGGGTTTSSSSSSSSTSSSGSGGCTGDADCDDQNPCTTDACTADKCVNQNIDGDVPGFTDTMKDCKTQQCVAGVEQTVDLDTDVPDNTDPCVTVSCNNGSVETTNANVGTSCGGTQQCDGMGNCVGCNKDWDCPQVGDCQVRNCNAQHICEPDDKNAGDSCSSNGGNVCDGSGTCVECTDDGDCNGPPEICVAHQCKSSCGDGTKNGNETDKDCGGACTTKCAVGKGCSVAADCTSSVCSGTPKTCQAPSCTDGVQNGSETDKDCGGATCDGLGKTCADGKKCGGDADCSSGHCNGGTCVPQCGDGAKDGDETDTDCGGSCSNKCATGKACGVDGDCQTTHCFNMVCVTACADGMKDGDETDTDCGGSCSTKCADGLGCSKDADCTNGFCNTTTNTCATPTCTDTFKNGTETDIDCGGTCPTKCAAGQTCNSNADCQSNNCNNGQKKCQ